MKLNVNGEVVELQAPDEDDGWMPISLREHS